MVTPNLDSQISSLRGTGQPISESERAFFEPRFAQDFGDVRVHTDAHSAALARSLDAHAFTLGRDLVFGAGCYSPHAHTGRRLLAHELTHVVQQTGSQNAEVSPRGDSCEHTASTIIRRQRRRKSPAAPIGNADVVAAARARSVGVIGTAYNWTPGWWYSPNPALAGARSAPLSWEVRQGALNPPPEGEVIVNWGSGQPTCNLFVYDVLCAAGLAPPLQSNDHYYNAPQTYDRSGSLASYFDLVDDPSQVKPGDVMATGPHVEIVTSTIQRGKFKAIGAHSDGSYEREVTHRASMRFLRKVVLGDFPVPAETGTSAA